MGYDKRWLGISSIGDSPPNGFFIHQAAQDLYLWLDVDESWIWWLDADGWNMVIWGQQEVFESQLEYHAGAAHFLGARTSLLPPPVFFWGVPKRGGVPKLSSCKRRTPTGYAFWKRHRPRKSGYPDFIIKLWNIWKIPQNPMVETCWKPQVPRHCIELSYIILWSVPPFNMRQAHVILLLLCRIFKYISISIHHHPLYMLNSYSPFLDHFTHRKTHGVPKLWLVTSIFCWFCPMTHPRVIIILIVSP